ncbi:thiosulfate transporter TsuA-like [Amphiura filiformis]|uniref:thiosulfate transporter TsuA-like n=1 Tax=Amphiura filiformis TaxID=82378 RepID=UPI003B20FE84
MFSARLSTSYCEENSDKSSASDVTFRKRLVAAEKTVFDQNGNALCKASLSAHVQEDSECESSHYRSFEPNFPIMWSTRYRIAVCIAAGVVFGLAMEKGRVFEPFNIRNQMLFQRNIMMKMFFSAMATSLLCLTVLSLIPSTRHLFDAARANYVCRFKTKGALTSSLGGWMLGMGMAISGSCPGAVLTQVGAGVKNCEYTLLGCLVGALIYGLTEKQVIRNTRPQAPAKEVSCDGRAKTSYYRVALPLACVVAAFVLTVEYVVPWKSELGQPNLEGSSFLALYGWPPLVAGMLVGLLQIPIVIAAEETIGGSSGYCTLVSQLFSKETLKGISPYLLSYKYGLDNWWQVFYIGGAVGGAFLSSTLSGTYGSASEVSAISGFTGAFIMVYGSRLAGGCTSGHGLSGIGTLSVFSFYTVPAMFAGGIATGVVMKLAGVF